MGVKIEFSTANAAFGEWGRDEIARILRDLAERFERPGDQSGIIRDLNGNTIGQWSATIDADAPGEDDNPFHPESPEGRVWAEDSDDA